jgi:hypothetical protein
VVIDRAYAASAGTAPLRPDACFEQPQNDQAAREDGMLDRGWNGLRWATTVAGALVALLVPAGAVAAPAAKPVAVTGGAANVTQSSVVLTGRVNPRGAATTYFFQYGTTTLFGSQTGSPSAGRGRTGVRVAIAVGNLAPATRYFYRLVARNSKGISRGKRRSFKTKAQPLGVTLAATPNPTRVGGATTLAGSVTGTGNGGRQVVLQSNPFPYTQGFATVGNAQVTNAQGAFAFPLLGVAINTQYRVLLPQKPGIVSPVVVLGTAPRVRTRVKVRRGLHRGRVRFRGRITPAAPGAQILIQKRRDGQWVTIAATFARGSSTAHSRYSKRIRQRRGGRYRVVANVTGAHVPGAGRTVRVRVRVRR